MSLAGQIAWDDTILPFQLDRADVRGRVARLDSVLETILGQHAYPAPVAALIAEAVLLTALIGQTIKRRWRLSLQIRGRGPVRLIATDYFGPTAEGEPARMRAYAGFDAEAAAAHVGAPFDLVDGGVFAILIDQGPGAAPYQGMTPVAGASLAECAETYFAQSEQLPTRFALAMGEASSPGRPARWRSGGVMLQHMPKAPPRPDSLPAGADGLTTAADLVDGEDADDWNRAVTLLSTVEATELIGPHVGPDQLLLRLFHEEGPRVYTPQPVRFGCTCGPEKVVRSLSIYSPEEIASMTTEDGRVTADCQFCGAHYEFDPAELGLRPEA
ncbi:Hsp33 family molecular chaperone HslO [Amaricoccus sp.]|uniref:Hsp33 family molecular chaperone HslO n=1 Tax=Amaricoccus sp. TaxID=1872485 RepID=UPI001B424203|nr:Hsp33 family molecular chaperone HslO [Amaricoccus sp.]MBP7002430.1 Hsp33 family molecular chaperone HslO [Amaricoccus sp.]